MFTLLRRWLNFFSLAAALAYMCASSASVQCPFHPLPPSTGLMSKLTDEGILLQRYADGKRGWDLVKGISGSSNAPTIEKYIEDNLSRLDLNGSGEFDTNDALVASRVLANPDNIKYAFRDFNLAGMRSLDAAISYVQNGCPGTVILPIEVLGPAGYTETVSFDLKPGTDPLSVTTLRLTCHRCGWRDGSVATGIDRGAKGSVRINSPDPSSPWTELSDANALVDYPAIQYGGISGGYATVSFVMSVFGLKLTGNRIEFRFNAEDGRSNGYRILALELRDSSENKIADNVLLDEDPTKWAPETVSGNLGYDIKNGEKLWQALSTLKKSPLNPVTMKASCSSCHAQDGRDLKYFNYSDWSITQRAQFHGLNQNQGRQIAAYIRSHKSEVVPQARPWNPPYQPGPGLDINEVYKWSAGAGLRAVLTNDADMMPYLFPNTGKTAADTTKHNLSKIIDPKLTLNVREIPLALQLPDWNAWLPEVHPMDVWGDKLTSSKTYAPIRAYNETRTTLQNGVNVDNGLIATVNAINDSVRHFVGEGATTGVPSSTDNASPWRTGQGDNINDVINLVYSREEAKLSLAQWSAVKQWEIMHEFNLQALALSIDKLRSGGEFRSWPSNGEGPHPLAPHISADQILSGFGWQSLVVGKYFSTAWYQVQMTVNSGQRQKVNVEPQDWGYQLKHINDLSVVSGVNQPLRLVESLIKAYQVRNNGVGPDKAGWQLRMTHPLHLHSVPETGSTQVWDALDSGYSDNGDGTNDRGLKKRLRTALASASLSVASQFSITPVIHTKSIGAWSICQTEPPAPPEHWYCIQPPFFTIVAQTDPTKLPYSYPGNQVHANNFATALHYFQKDNLIDQQVRGDYATWLSTIWTRYDWSKYANP